MINRSACRFALAALALGLASAPLAAQQPVRLVPLGPNPDWVEVNQTAEARGFVDRRSVRKENGMLRFQGRIDYLAQNEHGVLNVYHLGEIDCGRRQFRVVAFDSFGEGGRPVLSHTNSLDDYPWEPINAGSPNERMHREHC